MVRLLSDENFHGNIIRGLMLRRPEIDLIRVQKVGLNGAPDPEILGLAADEDRIVLTRDRATMPDFAYERIANGDEMPGMFVVNDRHPVREVIDELLLIDEGSLQSDRAGHVVYLPL